MPGRISTSDRRAVVILPADPRVPEARAGLRRWLSRGTVTLDGPRREPLLRALAALGLGAPRSGLAALRYVGQTDESPRTWVVAVDPVHLQARLRDLRVRHLQRGDVTPDELRRLFLDLQELLSDDGKSEFVAVGEWGYLFSDDTLPAASVSSRVADGDLPDQHTPDVAGADRYHRLLGETQMVLHTHALNDERQAAGSAAVNSLWFWGAGRLADESHAELPTLIADDPLFRGFWHVSGAKIRPWPGDLVRCADGGGFVAVVPDSPDVDLAAVVASLPTLIRQHRLERLTMLFGDGLRIDMLSRDRFRFWRRGSRLLGAATSDE